MLKEIFIEQFYKQIDCTASLKPKWVLGKVPSKESLNNEMGRYGDSKKRAVIDCQKERIIRLKVRED